MSKRSSPPGVAEWIVRRSSGPEESELVVGDFREEFDERAALLGRDAARKWYWAEALRSWAPLLRRRWQRSARQHALKRKTDPMWNSLLGDARYALRLSRRSPLASVAIISTMILGIGSTTAVFSATDAILLRPLPFPESNRTVELNGVVRDGRVTPTLAYPDLMDFRRTISDFAALAVYQPTDATLQHGNEPRFVHGLQVDGVYPQVFGVKAALGRLFSPTDAVVNAPKVAVLSYNFWVREFGADRSVVGHTIILDDESVQVVGVLAQDAYTFPRSDADLLTPLIIYPNTMMVNRGAMWAGAAAKLKPGASIEDAKHHLASAANLIATQFPNSNKGITATVRTVHESVVGPVQSMLQLLAGAMAAVLLIACINIANLILGRAQTRSREFAVRSAIGGSPARVRRQVFTESLVLAAIGGALGVLIAPVLTHALVAVYPDSLPRADEIHVDGRVLAVAALVTIAAGLLSALPTARRAGRLELADDLRDTRGGGGRGSRRTGNVLIVSQVAASLALLFSAGLLLQTFWRLTRVDPGFNARNVTTFHVFASNARYRGVPDIDRYYASVIADLRTIPGVREVSTSTMIPLTGGRFHDTFVQEEHGSQGDRDPNAAVAVVAPRFERALGFSLLRGRSFTAADDSASEPVVMMNDAAARRFYNGEDPVGRFISYNGKPHWRIIGVLSSPHVDNLWDQPEPVLYVSSLQLPRRSRYVVIRSDSRPEHVLTAAREKLHAIDPSIAITNPASMEDRIHTSLGPQRFRATLMVTLGGLALVLAIIGIYGVVAYTVTRRTREIGIRMAIGAQQNNVIAIVVKHGLAVALPGAVVGIIASVGVTRLLGSILFGVRPTDPVTLSAVAVLLLIVALLACYLPARRATRVDPLVALRYE
jgi:putative ABC transport system permease protein